MRSKASADKISVPAKRLNRRRKLKDAEQAMAQIGY